MRIIATNDADTASISVSPAAAATLPASNLQDPTRARVWRSTSVADQVFTLTWASPRTFSAFVLVRHNLTSSATWRIQIYTDAGATTLVYDSAAILANPPKPFGDLAFGIDPLGASVYSGWAYAVATHWLPAQAAGQAVKITLSDSGNPSGFLQASRLFIGNYIETADGPEYGVSLGWAEQTVQTRTEGGTLRSDPAEPYRVLSIPLGLLDQNDRSKILELSRLAGMRKDVFVSMMPGPGDAVERDYSMQAKLVKSPSTSWDQYNAWGATLEFEEA